MRRCGPWTSGPGVRGPGSSRPLEFEALELEALELEALELEVLELEALELEVLELEALRARLEHSGRSNAPRTGRASTHSRMAQPSACRAASRRAGARVEAMRPPGQPGRRGARKWAIDIDAVMGPAEGMRRMAQIGGAGAQSRQADLWPAGSTCSSDNGQLLASVAGASCCGGQWQEPVARGRSQGRWQGDDGKGTPERGLSAIPEPATP